jgi:histidine triad (HIT) family protein
MSGNCVFCRIIAGDALARIVASWPDAIAIVPLNPVVEGHLLVIPNAHVPDFTTDPTVTATAMARASTLAAELNIHPANLITSAGREATQSVWHLHVHLVPRAHGDGLALPW